MKKKVRRFEEGGSTGGRFDSDVYERARSQIRALSDTAEEPDKTPALDELIAEGSRTKKRTEEAKPTPKAAPKDAPKAAPTSGLDPMDEGLYQKRVKDMEKAQALERVEPLAMVGMGRAAKVAQAAAKYSAEKLAARQAAARSAKWSSYRRRPASLPEGMAKGGSVSASRRGDGIAQRGKTRGKLV